MHLTCKEIGFFYENNFWFKVKNSPIQKGLKNRDINWLSQIRFWAWLNPLAPALL